MKCFSELGLKDDASLEELRARWRELAAVHHPDKGGDPVAFLQLQTHYTTCRAYLAQPRSCPECGGRGQRVAAVSGFSTTWARCEACQGKGQVPGEPL